MLTSARYDAYSNEHKVQYMYVYNIKCFGSNVTDLDLSLSVRKPTVCVPTRSDTNRAVQSPKILRGWKFWIEKEEELYYPCSENKGTDQLRSYCEADLRLCFRLCRLLVFPCGGSYVVVFGFVK